MADLERLDSERHGAGVCAAACRPTQAARRQDEAEDDRERPRRAWLVGGDGLEPPTLSV